MKLYFSRNLNPRVAVAVARYLDAPVEYVHAAPLDPSQQENLAGLPLADYPHVAAWHARLWQLDAWRDPFAGLDAPELPEVPRADATGAKPQSV